MTAGSSVRTATAPSRYAVAALGDLEHPLLGAVDQLACGLALVVEDRRGDLGAGADQLPQQRALAHDLGVGAHVGGSRRVAGERAEIGKAAGVVQPAKSARAARRP